MSCGRGTGRQFLAHSAPRLYVGVENCDFICLRGRENIEREDDREWHDGKVLPQKMRSARRSAVQHPQACCVRKQCEVRPMPRPLTLPPPRYRYPKLGPRRCIGLAAISQIAHTLEGNCFGPDKVHTCVTARSGLAPSDRAPLPLHPPAAAALGLPAASARSPPRPAPCCPSCLRPAPTSPCRCGRS